MFPGSHRIGILHVCHNISYRSVTVPPHTTLADTAINNSHQQFDLFVSIFHTTKNVKKKKRDRRERHELNFYPGDS
jgi:hypothetical protein